MTHIITGVDRFMQLVEDRGSVSLKEASEILGVDQDTVKRWAEMLHSKNKVRLNIGFLDTVIYAVEPEGDKLERLKSSEMSAGIDTSVVRARKSFGEAERIRNEFARLNQIVEPELARGRRNLAQLELIEEMEAEFSSFIKKAMEAVRQDMREYRLMVERQARGVQESVRKNIGEKKRFAKVARVLREEKQLARKAIYQRQRLINRFLREQREARTRPVSPGGMGRRAERTLSQSIRAFDSKRSAVSALLKSLAHEEADFRQHVAVLEQRLGEKAVLDAKARKANLRLRHQQISIGVIQQMLAHSEAMLLKFKAGKGH
ncbi:hypothetical protein HYY74_00675 [Candidatus Woesearchaeota archaeon]|nr:hypothetical protein [Candidatus Woesearchaeota archaeon]